MDAGPAVLASAADRRRLLFATALDDETDCPRTVAEQPRPATGPAPCDGSPAGAPHDRSRRLSGLPRAGTGSASIRMESPWRRARGPRHRDSVHRRPRRLPPVVYALDPAQSLDW